MTYKLAPSLLAADFAALGQAIDTVSSAGAQYIHFDVMDGHFVANLSFGLPILNSIRPLTDLPFDVHLMVTNPLAMIEPFARAGADILTIHAESDMLMGSPDNMRIEAPADTLIGSPADTLMDSPADTLMDSPADTQIGTSALLEVCITRIKALGKKAAVALRPATPVSVLYPWLPLLDMVLIMSVEPGYGGQRLIPETLRKAASLADYAAKQHLSLDIEMDGGIDLDNVRTVLDAGVNVVVAGSAIFAPSPEQTAANTEAFAAILAAYAHDRRRERSAVPYESTALSQRRHS